MTRRDAMEQATQLIRRELMEQATAWILKRMRRQGFDLDGVKRHDPVVWDINNGWCRQWARRVKFLIPEALIFGDQEHWFVEVEGRFYDAECLDGVDDPLDLPFFAEPEVQRPVSN
jgi:hypothetical protein